MLSTKKNKHGSTPSWKRYGHSDMDGNWGGGLLAVLIVGLMCWWGWVTIMSVL